MYQYNPAELVYHNDLLLERIVNFVLCLEDRISLEYSSRRLNCFSKKYPIRQKCFLDITRRINDSLHIVYTGYSYTTFRKINIVDTIAKLSQRFTNIQEFICLEFTKDVVRIIYEYLPNVHTVTCLGFLANSCDYAILKQRYLKNVKTINLKKLTFPLENRKHFTNMFPSLEVLNVSIQKPYLDDIRRLRDDVKKIKRNLTLINMELRIGSAQMFEATCELSKYCDSFGIWLTKRAEIFGKRIAKIKNLRYVTLDEAGIENKNALISFLKGFHLGTVETVKMELEINRDSINHIIRALEVSMSCPSVNKNLEILCLYREKPIFLEQSLLSVIPVTTHTLTLIYYTFQIVDVEFCIASALHVRTVTLKHCSGKYIDVITMMPALEVLVLYECQLDEKLLLLKEIKSLKQIHIDIGDGRIPNEIRDIIINIEESSQIKVIVN